MSPCIPQERSRAGGRGGQEGWEEEEEGRDSRVQSPSVLVTPGMARTSLRKHCTHLCWCLPCLLFLFLTWGFCVRVVHTHQGRNSRGGDWRFPLKIESRRADPKRAMQGRCGGSLTKGPRLPGLNGHRSIPSPAAAVLPGWTSGWMPHLQVLSEHELRKPEYSRAKVLEGTGPPPALDPCDSPSSGPHLPATRAPWLCGHIVLSAWFYEKGASPAASGTGFLPHLLCLEL